MIALTKFAAVSTLLVLGACTPTTTVGSATEAEICRAWRDSLPTRSREDTGGTRVEIGKAYDVQAAACPEFARF